MLRRSHAFNGLVALTTTLVGIVFVTACNDQLNTGPEHNPPAPPSTQASQVAFLTQPSNATVGTAITPVTIAIQDANGNVLLSGTNAVTVSLESNPSAGALLGTAVVNAVGGIATFTDLAINQVGSGYTFRASVSGLPAAISEAFDVLAPKPEALAQALVEVRQVRNALELLEPEAYDEALMAYLAARPDVQRVAIAPDRTIVAEFADGLPVLFIDNRNALGADPDPQPSTRRSALPSMPASAGGVPQGDKAYIISVLSGAQSPPLVAGWLQSSGYTIAGAGVLSGTVDDLRAVSDADVLTLNTHGGVIAPDTAKGETVGRYMLGSADFIQVSDFPPTDSDRNWNERKAGLLVLVQFGSDSINHIAHWGITAKFVEAYWSFNPNSLVFIDGCSSFGSDEAIENFREIVMKKGASSYLGWSGITGLVLADEAGGWFFDRVLGMNDFPPLMDPPQRPFNFRQVLIWLGETQRDFYKNDETGGAAWLRLAEKGGESGILVPTIMKLSVDEVSEELRIEGQFGSEEASDRKVTLGGHRAFVKQWEERQITVSLKAEGTPFSGYVQVEVGEQKSNPVPLSGWQGTYTYNVDAGQLWGPNLRQQATCEFHFRADVHGYRKEPDGQVLKSKVPFQLARSSTCGYRMWGSGVDEGGRKVSLSGEGPMVWWDGAAVLDNLFAANGYIDVAAIKVHFSIILLRAKGQLTVDGTVESVPLIYDPMTLMGDDCPVPVPGTEPPGFDLPTDENFGVMAGNRSGDGPCEIDFQPTTLAWPAIPADSAPKVQDKR